VPRARCIYSAVAQAAAGFACACAYACLSIPLPNAALRRPLARVHTRVYVYILRARGPQYNRVALSTSGPPQKTEGVLFRWSMGWYFSRGGRSLARAVYRYVSCAPDMRMCVMWLWAERAVWGRVACRLALLNILTNAPGSVTGAFGFGFARDALSECSVWRWPARARRKAKLRASPTRLSLRLFWGRFAHADLSLWSTASTWLSSRSSSNVN
jgi:hypothetical protein